MTNLLHETREGMTRFGLTSEDVVYIGSLGSRYAPAYSCSWAEFERLADFEYDDGYGSAEIPGELKIFFANGGCFQRYADDGSEYWEYIAPFNRPVETLPIRTLQGGGWRNLHELHQTLDGVDADA